MGQNEYIGKFKNTMTFLLESHIKKADNKE